MVNVLESEIKMALRFHLTLVKMTTNNNTNKTNSGEDVGGKEHFCTVYGNVN
jgi:hypothetical protein